MFEACDNDKTNEISHNNCRMQEKMSKYTTVKVTCAGCPSECLNALGCQMKAEYWKYIALQE